MAKDMTKNELKEYLKDFRKIQAQKQYYDYILENDEYSTNYASDFKLFECVKLSLTILDEKEYFIIHHLILHYTWREISIKMIQNFGLDSCRTDRTLKRIQNLALEKLLIFINGFTVIKHR